VKTINSIFANYDGLVYYHYCITVENPIRVTKYKSIYDEVHHQLHRRNILWYDISFELWYNISCEIEEWKNY
jgi:hypothetical protein